MAGLLVPDVMVGVRGRVAADAQEYARLRISTLAEHTDEPILYARVKLTQSADPAVIRPAMAQANLDINGRIVRAHVAAESMHEAIDLLHARLVRRLGRSAQHWEARRGHASSHDEGEWRHGQYSEHRPAYFPLPRDQREIVRHKTFALTQETPDEAAFEMDAMDYDFHLFTEIGTGREAVIYRAGPTGYRLARVANGTDAAEPSAVSLTYSAVPAPLLTVSGAIERLDLTGEPFAFFVNADTERGNILYRRYDGNYGLIAPAD